MKPFGKALVIALVHVLLVSSLAAKLLYDRATRPRVWVKAAPYDPSLPIRGRYVSLQLIVEDRDFPPEESTNYNGVPAELIIEDGRLVATPGSASNDNRIWLRGRRAWNRFNESLDNYGLPQSEIAARQLNTHLGIEGGVFVWKVNLGSVADRAGVQPGDIVTSIDGRPTKNWNDISTLFKVDAEKGERRWEIIRDHKRLSLTVKEPGHQEVSRAGPSLLAEPVLYFIPEHVTDPSRRSEGEELWVEVTLPRKGPPRPIRLGVKKDDGPIEPLEFN